MPQITCRKSTDLLEAALNKAIGRAPADASRRVPSRGAADRAADRRIRWLWGEEVAAERVRFLLVGGYNTAVGYITFVLLYLAVGRRVHYLGILGMSHVLSVLNAYIAYRFLVFRVRGHWFRDLMRFWSVYLITLAANVAILPAMVEWLGLPVLAAQTSALAIIILGSYVGHKRFSFRRTPMTSTSDGEVQGG
jgi:putative flippase GtrA